MQEKLEKSFFEEMMLEQRGDGCIGLVRQLGCAGGRVDPSGLGSNKG